MFELRRAQERGHASHGWLDSRHTFSFADYYDPRFMGFGVLRVINDDRVAPGAGFGTHPHRNMEIVSYVVEGELEHRDSMGHGSVIRAGEVQRMTAGTGVTHSEYNHSKNAGLRFLQIWIIPERAGLEPSYEQKSFGEKGRNDLCLVASPRGGEDAVLVHQDVNLYTSQLEPGSSVVHELRPGRQVWLQMISGEVTLLEQTLHGGDGIAVVDERQLVVGAQRAAHFLLFDMSRKVA